MKKYLALVFCACICHCLSAAALEYGINNGAPINAQNGNISHTNDAQVLADTGTGWVRINFILGPWSSPEDATPRGAQGLSWFGTYDKIIDGMVAKGLKIYGLIGGEAVANSSRERLNTDEYVQEYTANFVKIVGHFKDRVKVYESFNEPNDWAGGTTSQVEPHWFAKYLEAIYRGVKVENGHLEDPTWQEVVLVTAPLFTHPTGPGGDYFTRTWQAGTTKLGWNDVKTVTGSYPFDGVGIHVYVAQGEEPDEELVSQTKNNLDSMHQSLVKLEGEETKKQFYLSEFGWNSNWLAEELQAHKMDVAFGIYELDGRIGQAHWFSLQDFPDGGYGIYRWGDLTPHNRKPSCEVFRNHATGVTRAKPPMNSPNP